MSRVGEVGLSETWAALAANPRAVLVDVRTVPEWQFVGVPDLTQIGKRLVTVPWMHYPNHPNPAFVEELRDAGIEDDQLVYLICRSGARSRNAAEALQQHGFTSCFNVTDGFEGPIDAAGQRNGGWKGAGLPWRQT